MKRTTKRFLLAAAALFFLLVVLSFFIPQYQSGSAQKARILQLAAHADRIVLDPNIFPDRPQQKPTTIVPGRSAVDDLLGRIEFETAFVHSHCMCIGDIAFRFQQNEREVLALTFHQARACASSIPNGPATQTWNSRPHRARPSPTGSFCMAATRRRQLLQPLKISSEAISSAACPGVNRDSPTQTAIH